MCVWGGGSFENDLFFSELFLFLISREKTVKLASMVNQQFVLNL